MALQLMCIQNILFGVTIPLGLIVSNGTDVKITKESELIAKSQQAELAKPIRASVLIKLQTI